MIHEEIKESLQFYAVELNENYLAAMNNTKRFQRFGKDVILLFR